MAEVSSSKRIYANEQTTTGVPFLRVSDLVAKINGIEKNDLYISEEHYMSFKKNGLVPKPNDVLITSRGTLGLCYIIKENDKFYFQDGMITWLSLHTNILPKYLCILFDSNFMQTLINEKSNGTAVSYISIADIKKNNISPPAARRTKTHCRRNRKTPAVM
ncbi:MAG: restriction endonuclease subunit S [Treponema sp.]|nr:restriction endonuclease subunit S [Treponema sp.]